MPLLRLETMPIQLVTPVGGKNTYEEITAFLGGADFALINELVGVDAPRLWKWQTAFPGMVETEDGADVYGSLGSKGFTETREEAIAIVEAKAGRFLDYIGVGALLREARDKIDEAADAWPSDVKPPDWSILSKLEDI